MKNKKTVILTEGAILLAIAVALSFITPLQRILPFGGSITLASMLPICMFSIHHGVAKGLLVSLLFSLFQLGQGIIRDGLLAWGLTPVMLICCILFDYIIAYTVLGAAGMFRKKGVAGWIIGTAAAMVLRFVSHFISGVVVFAATGKIWESLEFVADNKFVYSLVYNGAYMLPEIVFTLIVAAILFNTAPIKKMLKNGE